MISVIVPYYRQPQMLAKHLAEWSQYPQEVHEAMRLIIVDDCSPEEAYDVVEEFYRTNARIPHLSLFRVLQDVPWNRSMARNLGSHVAPGPWLLHMDTDHILPRDSAIGLARWLPLADPQRWYKFRRFRVGRADFTRNKDAIPRMTEYGEIKPHVDSFLCSRELYWKVGGYDPDYAGCLGGGGAFLRQLKKAGAEEMAAPTIHLYVYTSDKIPDSSIKTLDRDTSEYGRRRRIKERANNVKVTKPIRYPWERVL